MTALQPFPGAPHLMAYAVTDDAMRPRAKPGERVIVDPRLPCQTGDEVLVLTTDGRYVLVDSLPASLRQQAVQAVY